MARKNSSLYYYKAFFFLPHYETLPAAAFKLANNKSKTRAGPALFILLNQY